MRTSTEPRLRTALAVVGLLSAGQVSAAPPAETLARLQEAYASDVRAQARYAAFASRAAEEGDPGAAVLFRAAAHSEGVRARMYAAAIRRLGIEPTAPTPEATSLRTTRGNLLSTLAHENAERVAVYPRLIEQARVDGVPEAVLAFTLSHHAEEALVGLYKESVARSAAGPAELHVCETCGHVVRGAPPERCPVSLSPGSRFTRIH